MKWLQSVQSVVDAARAELARMFDRAVARTATVSSLKMRLAELEEETQALKFRLDDDIPNDIEAAVTEKFESSAFSQAVEEVVNGMDLSGAVESAMKDVKVSDLIDEDDMIDLVKQALRALAER